MNSEKLAKRIVYLAWKACGGPFGLGFLQNNSDADEEAVWNNVLTQGDYLCKLNNEEGVIAADYVFGRMMKLRFRYDETGIHYNGGPPTPSYQAWCRVYPTFDALLKAAKGGLDG